MVCLLRRLVLLSVGVSLAVPARAATVRGQVLHGSRGVPEARVSLVEQGTGVRYVNAGAAISAGPDGRFEFANVDSAKRWSLVVWDPFRPGEMSVVTDASLTGDNAVHVNKLIRFTEPAADAVVAGPRVRVRWTAVPDATRYTLEVEEGASLSRTSRSFSAPEAELEVQPARYYAISVTAQDASGTEIGANIIHGGAVHAFGVVDAKAESEMIPWEADCKIAGKEPHLRVAPTDSQAAEAPFMVSNGDWIHVRGKYGTWRKVTTVSGYYPGKDGWLTEGETVCPAP